MTAALLLSITPPLVAAPGWPVMAVVGVGLLLLAGVVYKVGKGR